MDLLVNIVRQTTKFNKCEINFIMEEFMRYVLSKMKRPATACKYEIRL